MEKIKQLAQVGGPGAATVTETLLRMFNDLFSRQALNSGTLVVGTTTTKLKVTSQISVVNGGVLAVIAASDGTISWVESGSTVLPTNTLSATQIGGYVFTFDTSGLYHAYALVPSANLASNPGFPLIPPNHVVFGLALINTASAATFTAGTTALNAANVQLVNVVGPFSPTNAF